MQNHLRQLVWSVVVIGAVAGNFQNPYPPTAALFGPQNQFICNGVVLGRGRILTAAYCLYLERNGSHSVGLPGEFHVALETHNIQQLHDGKAFGGKGSKWKYLEKLNQKLGNQYDNKYANGVLSDNLKPEEMRSLKKALQSRGLDVRPRTSNYLPVLGFWFHPDYKRDFSNEVVLLLVSEQLPTESTAIAEMSSTAAIDSAFNRVVQVYGFGVLSHAANETDRPVYFKIRTVEMYLMPPSMCQKKFEDIYKPDQHLCLMPKGKEQLCYGFTGAPIVLDGELIGIVEFGAESCSLKSPVVGIRVDKYRNFLGAKPPSMLDYLRKFLKVIMGVFL